MDPCTKGYKFDLVNACDPGTLTICSMFLKTTTSLLLNIHKGIYNSIYASRLMMGQPFCDGKIRDEMGFNRPIGSNGTCNFDF